MTRKITLSIVLVLLVFGCYALVFGNNETIRGKLSSVSELKTASKSLNTKVAELERKNSTEYEEKKKELSTSVAEYKSAKEEYDALVPTYTVGDASATAETKQELEGIAVKDIYDVDFLWTIIGNYATEEGVDVTMNFFKNITSASSINNTSSNYVVCDLKFVITGNYINLTDFIYDLEDDDRLSFKINDFEMQKAEDKLQVLLTVKEVKVNTSGLIQNSVLEEITLEDNGLNETEGTETNTTTNTTTSNTTNANKVSNDVN